MGPPALTAPADIGSAALAGVDAWSGGGGPAAELRLGAASRPGPLQTWLGGSAEVIGDPAGTMVFDYLRAEVALRRWARLAPTAAVAVSGSIAGPWGSGLATVGLDGGSGPTRASVGVGAGARYAGGVAPEGWAGADASHAFGPVLARAGVSVRALGGGLPPLVLEGSGWIGAGRALRVEVGAVATGVPAAAADAVPGLPTPGTVVLQGLVAGGYALADRVALRIEAGPEAAVGEAPYQRVRVLAGLRADLGSEGPRRPEVDGGLARFVLDAPGAERVELLGAFADWRPVEMRRDGRRWAVTVPVPAGSWEFVYRVDGRTVVPPAADRWVPDGYGGTNGVVVVDGPTLVPEARR